MKIVLDTNVLLVSVSDVSPFHWIWKSLESGKYTLCVTTDILNEYAEIIGRHMGEKTMESTLNALVKHRFVQFVEKYFVWNLIEHDPDDNKFADCAIACNADFLVTHDKHFNVLKKIPFPKISVIDVAVFETILKQI